MRKILLLVIIGLFAFQYFAYAHPPEKIETAFDSNTKILYVTITHPVDDPESHFIKEVTIMLNDKEVIRHKINRQDNTLNQALSYMIPDAQSGDEISIGAYCSIEGTLTEKILVP